MSRNALVLAAALAGIALPSFAQDLPDLGGRTIKAVTENAYYPLNFEDPTTGKGIGLEYDVMNEVAKRLNATVEWNLTAWDVMIEAVRSGPVRRRHGWHLDHRRARGGDRLHRSVRQPRPVHDGACRREPHYRARDRSRRSSGC